MDVIEERITELKAKGESLRAIGRDVKLSHVAVLKRLKRMGPTPKADAGRVVRREAVTFQKVSIGATGGAEPIPAFSRLAGRAPQRLKL